MGQDMAGGSGNITTAQSFNGAIAAEMLKGGKHPVSVILLELAQLVLLVGGFWVMAQLMSFGGSTIRGDFLVYLVTGVFFFQVHVKAMGAAIKADSARAGAGTRGLPGRVAAAACATLFVQAMAAVILLTLYHTAWEPISIHQPAGFAMSFLLAWGSGISIGLVLLAFRQRAKAVVTLIAQTYSRANMLASGQMFVANMLPAQLVEWFLWNPLFHIIDQARGHAFLNYTPWYTNAVFPAVSTLCVAAAGILLCAGLRIPAGGGLQAAASDGEQELSDL